MQRIKITDVKFENRAREDYGDLSELASSILTHGLIQPIVLDENNNLIAGGRRFSAFIQLGLEEIPYISFGSLSSLQKKELELEENLKRKDLTWQEVVRLHAEIDKLKREANPTWTMEKTAESVKMSKGGISENLALAKMLETHPEFAEVKERGTAMSRMKRIKEAEKRELFVQAMGENKSTDIASVIAGNALEVLKTIPDNSVSLVLFDPPYGMNWMESGHNLRHGASPEAWHETYEDFGEKVDEDTAQLVKELYRVMIDGAHLYYFFSLSEELKTLKTLKKIKDANLSQQLAPLFWVKTTHTCKDPYHRFAINYEPFYFCWKGSKSRALNEASFATFSVPIYTGGKNHPAEKPVELYKKLITLSTIEGELVLDPTCGSGNALVAAQQLNRPSIGIEKSETWAKLAIYNIKGGEDNNGNTEN